jgi:basic amino acid/polyamine antiporter, APA family
VNRPTPRTQFLRIRPVQETPKKQLTLFDSTCLIVGIIIGAGIYEVVPDVAKGTSNLWCFLGIWAVGGVISLCGALGYAELATAYPREGGDYVYLTRAYGRWAGFLFGWLQLAVVRPGDIAGMAFIFARYAQQIYNPFPNDLSHYWSYLIYALAAVAILTGINVIGVPQGKWTQNLLTTAKAIGLLAIVTVAIAGPGSPHDFTTVDSIPLSLALIFVLFTFGGWNEMAYVAAEVKNPSRNIIRALVLGTVSVTILYLLVNVAFVYALGFSGAANSKAVAADTVSTMFPKFGAALVCALICISALGATNGLIFTGARISYAVGAEHRVFSALGRWNSRTGTPARALLLQGAIAMSLIVLLGSFVNAILYTAAAVYTFYVATSLAVMVLRYKEPDVERPYRVTGYPLPTIAFCAVCGFLIHGAATYKPGIAAGALAILLIGLPLYWWSNRMKSDK